MKSEKIVLTDTSVIIPKDMYIEAWSNVCHISQFLEDTECVGDDMFQAEVARSALYLLCRTFPLMKHEDANYE